MGKNFREKNFQLPQIFASNYTFVIKKQPLLFINPNESTGIIKLFFNEQISPENSFECMADRFETMSTAIAASYLNIPLVHVHGQ